MSVRVLLIDDDPVDRELAARALRALAAPPGPVELVTAASWSEARAHLATGGFDLLLLDFHLPDLDGLTILNQLAATPHPPVIMTTGQDDLQTAVEILRSGAYDYVQKTADGGPALRLTVTRVLERVRLERELAASRARLESYAAELEERVAARTAVVHAQASEIEALYLRAEEATRVKTEILANLSHELRTPLNGIIGYVDLLEDELPAAGADAARAMLTQARTQITRLRAVVESLLTLVQLRKGKTDRTLSRFTCRALLEDLRADALLLAGEKGLDVELDSPCATAEVEHDREKIRAIGYHLLSNAIKFTHAGRVTVTLAAAGGGLTLTITDTGIGVPAASRALMFEDFRQVDGSSTRRFEGLGVGLGIVKRFTALLGGRLALESAPDAGTTVRVEIPPPTRRDGAAVNRFRSRTRAATRAPRRARDASRPSSR